MYVRTCLSNPITTDRYEDKDIYVVLGLKSKHLCKVMAGKNVRRACPILLIHSIIANFG